MKNIPSTARKGMVALLVALCVFGITKSAEAFSFSDLISMIKTVGVENTALVLNAINGSSVYSTSTKTATAVPVSSATTSTVTSSTVTPTATASMPSVQQNVAVSTPVAATPTPVAAPTITYSVPAATVQTTTAVATPTPAVVTPIATVPTATPVAAAPIIITSASIGSTGANVTAIQNILIAAGYMSGSATGYFGTQTQAAVKAFQAASGLATVGNVGPQTGAALTLLIGNATLPIINPGILCATNAGPSVHVTSPNGGQSYAAGQAITVTWTSCNIPSSTHVQLSLVYVPTNATYNLTGVMAPTVSQGTAGVSVTLPSSATWPGVTNPVSWGTNYKIQVTSATNSTVTDSSDTAFTINSNATSPLVNVIIDPAVPSQTVSPNTTNQIIGAWFVLNNSTIPLKITSIQTHLATTGFLPSALSNLSMWAVSAPQPGYIFGTAETASTVNTFTDTRTVLPGQEAYFALQADIGNIAGTVQATITPTVSFSPYTSSYALSTATVGQLITISAQSCGVTPVILTSASTAAQYISAAPTGATNASQVAYNLTSTVPAPVSELKFTAVGPQTVTAIKIGTTTVPVVNGVADFTGLNIPVAPGGQGTNVIAYLSYPPVGVNGLVSGTTSTIYLSLVRYQCGGAMNIWTPDVPLASPTMTLVGSQPTVTFNSSNASLVAGYVDIGSINITAAPNGTISINKIPLMFASSGSVGLTTSVNSIILKNSGIVVPTTNPAFGSAGGTLNGDVTLSNGYLIGAGTAQTFEVYVPVASVGPNSTLGTSLNPSSGFVWTDVAGNGAAGGQSGTLIYNYPTNGVYIHN